MENSEEVKEGAGEDFRYLEGTVHRDDVVELIYETTRVLDETYPRLGNFVVAYRRLVDANDNYGPEDKDVIHIRDDEKMTACTDIEVF